MRGLSTIWSIGPVRPYGSGRSRPSSSIRKDVATILADFPAARTNRVSHPAHPDAG
jgi:hypothetical protein